MGMANFRIFALFSDLEGGLSLFQNEHIKGTLRFRGVESGLRFVFPESSSAFNFYARGAVYVLRKTNIFMSCIRSQNFLDRYSSNPNVFYEAVFNKFEELKQDSYLSVLDFHKASFTLLNSWANIKSVSVLNISDEESVLKDVYNRVSSKENFVEVFDGVWKVYEFAVRNIPDEDLSKNHGVFFRRV